MSATGIGASVRRRGGSPLHHRQGPLRRRRQPARPGPRLFPALAACPCHDQRHRHQRGRQAAPGVLAVFTGDDLAADKIGGLICGWMIHSKDGSPMKAGPASGAGPGQGALRRRPCRGGHRRDLCPGQGRGREDRGRLRRAAGRRRHGQGPQRSAASRCTRSRPTTPCSSGTSATRTRPRRPSPAPPTSPSSTSSTTG